jgi:curved DNA-binding protein CbpA
MISKLRINKSYFNFNNLYSLSTRSIGFNSSAAQSDPYYVLGSTKDEKMADIKKKYFALAKKYHPDMNPDDKAAEKLFLEIQEAYKFIQMDKNPLLREKYSKEFNRYDQGSNDDPDFKSKRGKRSKNQ